jgi:hypothetical protein
MVYFAYMEVDLIFAAAVCVQPDLVGLKFTKSMKGVTLLRRFLKILNGKTT